jgi:hypothetical protein
MDHLRVSLEDSDKAGVNSPELRERIATLRKYVDPSGCTPWLIRIVS